MKWENWLGELDGLPADDPAWDGFEEFIVGATQVATAKKQQRESAQSALEELLSSLRERHGVALARLGWAELSHWQSAPCSPSQALRLVAPLAQLQDLLERYDEALQQTPATPQDFQALRHKRTTLEDDILPLASSLDAFFLDPLANSPLESELVAPKPS